MTGKKTWVMAAIGGIALATISGVGGLNHAAQAGPKAGPVGPWDAMKAADAKVPGGKALSATYTKEGANWMYDVIVVKGKTLTEVEVNAQTGKAGDSEVVTPEEEGKELADDLNVAIGNKAKPAGAEKPEAP